MLQDTFCNQVISNASVITDTLLIISANTAEMFPVLYLRSSFLEVFSVNSVALSLCLNSPTYQMVNFARMQWHSEEHPTKKKGLWETLNLLACAVSSTDTVKI